MLDDLDGFLSGAGVLGPPPQEKPEDELDKILVRKPDPHAIDGVVPLDLEAVHHVNAGSGPSTTSEVE